MKSQAIERVAEASKEDSFLGFVRVVVCDTDKATFAEVFRALRAKRFESGINFGDHRH